MPAATAPEKARTSFEFWLMKATGIAPRPVARALKTPVQNVQNNRVVLSKFCL